MTNPDLAALSEAAKAKAEAMAVRYYEGIPIRVLERDGRVIWSKVDDELRDLTTENSEGLLFHVRSVFVPHGKPNPLSAFSDHTDNLVQIDEGMRERVARAMALAANDYEGPDLQWQGWTDNAQAAITAHTAALIADAGELEQRLTDNAHMIQRDGLGPMLDTAAQAAATIAAQKAEIERLTEREARAKLDGVRAGIEAAFLEVDGMGTRRFTRDMIAMLALAGKSIRALDPEAIAKGEG